MTEDEGGRPETGLFEGKLRELWVASTPCSKEFDVGVGVDDCDPVPLKASSVLFLTACLLNPMADALALG